MAAFDNELAGPPNALGKYSGYDVGALEAKAPQQTPPSPQGAASQGDVGDPASAGKAPALQDEDHKDMLSIFNSASDEDRDYLTTQQTEALAPHGKSLEGGLEEVLTKGGPQAMARAAQFGIDLTGFANKINPAPKGGGPEAKQGQAFGNVPTEKQSAGGEAFKSQEQAVGDVRKGVKKNADTAAAKKKVQRDAIAAFLTETGLRILASNREDVGGAFGEAALGTMESGAARKRQAAADKMKADETARQNRREDTSDEAAKVRAQQQTEEFEHDKSQWAAEDARKGLVKIIDEDDRIIFVNKEEGMVTDEDGVPRHVANEYQKRAAARAGIDSTAKNRAILSERSRLRKIIESGYSDDEKIQAIIDEKDDDKKRTLLNAMADKNVAIEPEETRDYDSLDW